MVAAILLAMEVNNAAEGRGCLRVSVYESSKPLILVVSISCGDLLARKGWIFKVDNFLRREFSFVGLKT